MNLVIYINTHYEEERALIDLDNGKVILKGDYYHDKIDHVIEGYIKALVDMGLYADSKVPERYIDRNHWMYNTLEFYDDEYDEPDNEVFEE